MSWPTRVWAVGEILTAANMIAFISDPHDEIDALLDLSTPTVHTLGGFLFGGGAGAAFTASAVLADGEIMIGDGVTLPVAVAAFTASTGFLKLLHGGLEFNASGIAKGGLLGGDGAGSMAIEPVGTDGFALVADAASARGFKWSADVIPAGVIILMAAACPSGFTEYTNARGRALVGVPSGGTLEGTVGSALTNLLDRTHTHSGPSHSHSHTHTIAHNHSHDHTLSAHTHAGPSHTHPTSGGGGSGTFGINVGASSASGAGLAGLSGGGSRGQTSTGTASGGTGGTGVPSTDLTDTDAAGSSAANTGNNAQTGGTGATGTAATSGVIPYIQMRLCQKD